jgi:hypothetical protein
VIKGKRRSLQNLVIRNYAPLKIPLYAPVAGQAHLMDLFGLAASS